MHIVIEAEGLEEAFKEADFNIKDVHFVDAHSLTGETVIAAALITLAATSIKALAKVLAPMVAKERKVVIKVQGKEISLESQNADVDYISSLLTVLHQKGGLDD